MTMLLAEPPARTRRAVTASLAGISGLSWAYLVFLSTRMTEMGSPFALPMTSAWTGQQVVLMWTMWSVMMAGMMLPSAAPMVSAYSRTIRSGTRGLHGSTGLFVVGYLATWSGFAMLATGAQWALHDAALVNAMGIFTSNWLGGALLVMAGAYQFTGLKQSCLRQCRTPLGFLMNHWRNGRAGALLTGMHHGVVCVGCCWALMTLLFVLGVMNLWWVALLAVAVLLEKLVPSQAISRILGAALAVWGVVLMTGILS
ncbi:MAG: DUF2182 domain-containing protein [Microbacteriaceae bacterium]